MQDIKNAGAAFLDQKVVVDNNYVSSRNPDDTPVFIQAALKNPGQYLLPDPGIKPENPGCFWHGEAGSIRDAQCARKRRVVCISNV